MRLPIHGVIDWLSHRNVLAGPQALNLKGRIGEVGAGRGDTNLLYELAHRIRERQFRFGPGRPRGSWSLKQMWERALA
jgi:hypothetical protein